MVNLRVEMLRAGTDDEWVEVRLLEDVSSLSTGECVGDKQHLEIVYDCGTRAYAFPTTVRSRLTIVGA